MTSASPLVFIDDIRLPEQGKASDDKEGPDDYEGDLKDFFHLD